MKQIIGAVLLAALLAPSLAAAHALLQQASPADGSVIYASPESLAFTFSENAHLTALTIQGQNAAAAQRITALPGEASRHFTVATSRLAPGSYTIRYRVMATDDGHITAGAIRFPLAAGGATTSAAAPAAGAAAPGGDAYRAVGTVERVDPTSGRVSISHEPIARKDKALYDKLTAGKRAQFTLGKQGALYVVTGVR